MRARLRELQLALMLLTRLPVGRITGEAPPLAAVRWAFPVVGLLIGLIGWAVYTGAMAAGAPAPVAAVLCVAAQAFVTGALHFDGLSDFADGIGGGRDRTHALDIMRDSRVGSYGALALVLAVALWLSSLATLKQGAVLPFFLIVAALSRVAMVALQETLPAARADGVGHLASGRSVAARLTAICTVLLSLILCSWNGMAIVVVCAAIAIVVGSLARMKLGGITGDALGATQIIAEAMSWAVLATINAV